jgi:hypothetical protein
MGRAILQTAIILSISAVVAAQLGNQSGNAPAPPPRVAHPCASCKGGIRKGRQQRQLRCGPLPHDRPVALASLLEDLQEQIAPARACQPGPAMITTTGEKVKIVVAGVAVEAGGHILTTITRHFQTSAQFSRATSYGLPQGIMRFTARGST